MKVSELIAMLKKMPEDADVVLAIERAFPHNSVYSTIYDTYTLDIETYKGDTEVTIRAIEEDEED